MINRETNLPYANPDLFSLRMRAGREHIPSWQGSWIYCVRFNDEESAHLIRLRNDERYAERCEQEALNTFPLEHNPLLSIRESYSEENAEVEDQEVMA